MKYIFKINLLLLFLISGCNFSEDFDQANSAIDSFFNERIEKGSIAPSQYYIDNFMSNNPDEWIRIQKLVQEANGNLLSYERSGWQIQNKSSTSELSGTFVYYSFNTVYEKGEGTETITVLKNTDNPSFKVIGHHFDSKMIQDLVNQGINNVISSDSLGSK